VRAGVELMPSGERGVEFPDSCSIGMVMLGPQIGSAEEALSQARAACRKASEDGNAVARYRPTRATPVDGNEDAQWIERLKYALNNDDFYSVQNTIMSLEGDSEGLFENRTFLHEEDHDTDLDAFALIAGRVNLASTIDRQVIPGLLRVISGTGDRHFINVSANSVQDFSFPSWFQRQLHEFDVEGSQLVLQLSADSANANLRATRRMFEELASQGCSFSISHFDDCKHSIELLEKLDLSYVKLPPGISVDLAQHPTNQSVIRNVAAAAAVAGVKVFADEVNNPADMALLWQCGVKLVSGDFLQDEPRVIGQ
jgi:EAL domain-containing protein (putative c-di-GMP-specific phosphodiesterase class I)